MTDSDITQPPGREPVLTENALTILQNRYLLRDRKGKCIETPAQMFSRVAALIAGAEAKYGEQPQFPCPYEHRPSQQNAKRLLCPTG
ncbi:MAG: ribonucleotide reductase N-terminal alpha domain-containing protein [Planctomycetota bacterium]|jgi:ribonucleotide reductase alpha subunit